MSRLLTIGEAAEVLGVSVPTLRRWDAEGRLQPDERTAGGQRRYDLGKLRPEQSRADEKASRKTVAYAARVQPRSKGIRDLLRDGAPLVHRVSRLLGHQRRPGRNRARR